MQNEKKLRINFALPPSPKLSGGPLAIIEYATRLRERGHDVSITTFSDAYWESDQPFPWAKFDGPIHYLSSGLKHRPGSGKMQKAARAFAGFAGSLVKRGADGIDAKGYRAILSSVMFSRAPNLRKVLGEGATADSISIGMGDFLRSVLAAASMSAVMPECDLNIATTWMTALPVLWSGKGKPVYFMQHYEEVFYPTEYSSVMQKLGARMSYELPMYKVANSSWLAKRIEEKFGQAIPFSNNGLDLGVFQPGQKQSEVDGKIRVITYSRPEEWKGFGDAVEIMKRVLRQFPNVEWDVFGYANPLLPPDNPYAPYRFHKGLSYKDLAALYAKADITLCPSWYESYPLPPIEGMAAGTAVVTTDYGTEDYARDRETALVFGARDVEKGAALVCEFIKDAGLRSKIALAGLNESKKFSWDHAVVERERILLDIHAEKTTYDRFLPINHGFKDGYGKLYSESPVDLEKPKRGLRRLERSQEVFLFDGKDRRLVSPSRLQDFADLGPVTVVDPLTFARTPEGFQIR